MEKCKNLVSVCKTFKNLRVPTVMENPGKSWKNKWSWKVMEKSWKRAKIQNVMEFCLPKKSHRKVMEISCPNPPNRVPIVL